MEEAKKRRPMGNKTSPEAADSGEGERLVGKAIEARISRIQLFANLARNDVHAVGKLAHGGKFTYRRVDGPVDELGLHEHLADGPTLGVYLMNAGSAETRLAVLDLDDHDGRAGWKRITEAAERLAAEARLHGLVPWPVRSGGGRGIHLWFHWDEPQHASDVRSILTIVLGAEGFKAGAAGVSNHEIEIFPKQDAVDEGGYGNLIALPFGRESVPLGLDFQPVDTPGHIISSQPVRSAPPSRGKGRPPKADAPEIREALTFVSAAPRDEWVRVGLALKHELGDDGFEVWDEWSQTSVKYPGEDEAQRRWQTLRPDGRVTLATVFWLARQEGWSGPQSKRSGKSAAVVLAAIVNGLDLWIDDRGTARVTISVDGHSEHLGVNDEAFRLWLGREYYLSEGRPPSPQALKQAVELAAGEARYGNRTRRRVWIRVAEEGGRLYLDLGDVDWKSVEVDVRGWRIVPAVPVRFTRSPTSRALPTPVAGGSVEELRQFINVDAEDFMLVVAWLVACFRPDIPVPVLYLSGEQGSAKTTALKLLVRLLDPRTVEAAGPPRNVDDLIVSAASRRIVTIDNVSRLNDEMSDAFCRLATGGGLEKREHYTNDEVYAIDAMRPVLMTGITPATDRPDFLDRVVLVTCRTIDGALRLDEATLAAKFEAARPRILGAILDGVVTALRRMDEVRDRLKAEHALPRMADFAICAEAAGAAFGWKPGAFIEAHRRMLDEQMVDAAAADIVASTIRSWLEAREEPFKGRPADLCRELTQYARNMDGNVLPRQWPKNATHLGRWLTRAARPLAALGVICVKEDKGNRPFYRLQLIGEDASELPLD